VTSSLTENGMFGNEVQRCTPKQRLSMPQGVPIQPVTMAYHLSLGCLQVCKVLDYLFNQDWHNCKGGLVQVVSWQLHSPDPHVGLVYVCDKFVSISLCCRLSHSCSHLLQMEDCCDLPAGGNICERCIGFLTELRCSTTLWRVLETLPQLW
jgi:hypothetical protein